MSSAVSPAMPSTVSSAAVPRRVDGALDALADPAHPARALLVCLAAAQAAGLTGVPFVDRDGWYDGLRKPSFNPPSSVFGPVWTVLYAMIGVAAWRVVRAGEPSERRGALAAWAAQLALNALWTPLFFGARRLGLALAEMVVLWLTIALTVTRFARLDRTAAALLLPYQAWVTFAGVLNASLLRLNPGER